MSGKLKILTYKIGRSGEYILFLYGKRIATVDNIQEAVEQDEILLQI